MKITIIKNLNSKLRKRLFRILAVLGIIGSFVVPLIPLEVRATGTTYYVATTGNDSHAGTLASPWLTINHAAQVVVAGDTVNIEAGTYGSFSCTNSGTAGSPITYQNYNNAVVNIDGGTGYDDWWDHSKSYITFIGLRGIGTTTVGIEINGSNIIVQNCYFSNCTSSGIEGGAGPNITIDSCELSGTNTTPNNECISLYATVGFVIKNCLVHDPASGGRIGIDVKNGCSNGSIYSNVVYDCTAVGIYIDGYGYPSSNINIYNNTVFENSGAGMTLNSESSPAIQTNINFYNNLVYNNYSGFTVWATPDFPKTFTLINNTFYNNGTLVEIGLYGSAANNAGCVIRNNIIDNSSSAVDLFYYPAWSSDNGTDVTIDHNLFYDSSGTYNVDTYGTNYQKGNPNLSNPTTSFALTSSSTLAINTASATGAPSTDYIWTVRPQGTGYDIGAYEFLTNPTLTVSPPTSVAAASAILNGNVTYAGIANPIITIYYDTTDYGSATLGWTHNISATYAGGITVFSANISSLSPATLYYFNAKADNTASGGGISWSGSSSFMTLPNAPTSITATPTSGQVVLNWTNAVGGTGTSIYTRVQWSTSAYPTSYTDGTTGIAWTSGTTGTIVGLTNGVTYYFSAFTKVTDGALTQYSPLSAQVYAIPPTTSNIGSIGNLVLLPTDITISLTWQRATNSASTVIRYSTTAYPATPTDGISVSSSTITGSSILLTGLTAGTNYYFSAWGFNSGNYGSATESMMTTTASGGTNDVLPAPTINMTPSAPSSGNWFTTLQPFTGFVADFENSWGMPKDSVPFVIGILILLLGGFGLYLKTKSPFIAIVADMVLDIGLIALGLLPMYTVGVVIAFGLGIWALDNIWI